MVNGTADPYMSIDRVREFESAIKDNNGFIQVFENQGGTHSDPGDFHVEEMVEIISDVFTYEK